MLQNMNSRDWKQTYINAAVGRFRVHLFGALGAIIFTLCFVFLAYLYVWFIGVPLYAGIICVFVWFCLAFCASYVFAIFGEAIWNKGLEIQTAGTIILMLAAIATHIIYVL